MSILRIIFLITAIIGAIMPMRYFIQWFNENSWSLVELSRAWNVNAASTGLVWDLTIAAIALSIWALVDSIRRKVIWQAIVCVLATWCIGVSCGLPLFLFLRMKDTA